jgi:biofilm PGA synthesis N-glycosyltransferase PgaC
MRTIGDVLLAFVALYPVCTAALWMAGGLLFRWLDETTSVDEPERGWPGVSVLIPAYNEANVIAVSVGAALAADYPELEVLVLDDGSTDDTESAAQQATGGDRRCRVLRDPVNRGKADRLNVGLREARHELVAIVDADTHLHPQALKLLVARMSRSPLVAAVAGAPHVTNRGRFLQGMQVLEAASIIGLIRRTQSLTGRVGVIAGVLGLYRRDRVLAVGGFDPRMATEDIDLTWKLLLAGWETVYEPRALVGVQVPSTLSALWVQRKRWARGQGEVLHVHLRAVSHWRNHRMWLVSLESLASLVWVVALAAALLIAALGSAIGGENLFGFELAWGIAIAAVATLQLLVALTLERSYDPTILRPLLVAAVYPLVYWTIAAAAALRSQTVALLRGPRRQRVVWDIPREQLETRVRVAQDTPPQDRSRQIASSDD